MTNNQLSVQADNIELLNNRLLGHTVVSLNPALQAFGRQANKSTRL